MALLEIPLNVVEVVQVAQETMLAQAQRAVTEERLEEVAAAEAVEPPQEALAVQALEVS